MPTDLAVDLTAAIPDRNYSLREERAMRLVRILVAASAVLLSSVAASTWNPDPLLADLAQIRTAIDRDYPNREWLTSEREVSLDRWFARAEAAIRNGDNAGNARRALDQLIERFDDGHMLLRWPTRTQGTTAEANKPVPADSEAFCAARGYDAGQVSVGTAAGLPTYRRVEGDGPFNAGLVPIDGATIGVIRIGVFSPQGYPALCRKAVAATRTAVGRPCDDACEDRLLTEEYALLTRGLMRTVERLREAGADVLAVDVTRNGGGSEWAEAAARIVSPVPIRSAPMMVMRGDAWVARWHELAGQLRSEARRASSADRKTLSVYATRADALAGGSKPCDEGRACSRLADAGFGTGLVHSATASQFAGKHWAPTVFSPAQYPYRDHVWTGPLMVLVDGETWSAAEQFAALLQDNRSAIVVGERTGGAGCGHLDGNNPVTLANSKAVLEMPNCARFRKDGRNEVGGIVPDVATGIRWNDGATFAGHQTAKWLPEAVAKARAQRRGD